jgi:hypothetical protein
VTVDMGAWGYVGGGAIASVVVESAGLSGVLYGGGTCTFLVLSPVFFAGCKEGSTEEELRLSGDGVHLEGGESE